MSFNFRSKGTIGSVVGIGAAVAILFGVFGQSDPRIVGTYTVDQDQTSTRWTLHPLLASEGYSNVLEQIFHHAPVEITDRAIIKGGDQGLDTNGYHVIRKGTDHTIIAFSPLTWFRVEHANDGLWLVYLTFDKYPMIVKLRRMESSTSM